TQSDHKGHSVVELQPNHFCHRNHRGNTKETKARFHRPSLRSRAGSDENLTQDQGGYVEKPTHLPLIRHVQFARENKISMHLRSTTKTLRKPKATMNRRGVPSLSFVIL